jgi:hypothetical protein
VSPAEEVPEVKKSKAETDFQRQNKASKRLVNEVDEAVDIMLQSLLKEINEVLFSDSA